jgi:hypothetical protein
MRINRPSIPGADGPMRFRFSSKDAKSTATLIRSTVPRSTARPPFTSVDRRRRGAAALSRLPNCGWSWRTYAVADGRPAALVHDVHVLGLGRQLHHLFAAVEHGIAFDDELTVVENDSAAVSDGIDLQGELAASGCAQRDFSPADLFASGVRIVRYGGA